jgi:hypothetical protein
LPNCIETDVSRMTVEVSTKPIVAEPAKQRSGQISRAAVAPSPTTEYDAADKFSRDYSFTNVHQPLKPRSGMKPQRFDAQFAAILDLAAQLCAQTDAGSLLVMLEGPTDWEQLRERAGELQVVVAADTAEELAGAAEANLATIVLNMADSPVIERLTQALLTGVAREVLSPGARLVVVYSGFEVDTIDSVSYIELDEHLGRLTARDLRQLETSVPLETLKTVIDLAVEIGREGREGKPVGTMFVVGDTRKVLQHCQPAGFDPVRGYNRSERDLHDPRPPLGRRSDQQSHHGPGDRRQPIQRHRAPLPRRRSDAPHRASPPCHEVERLRLRAAPRSGLTQSRDQWSRSGNVRDLVTTERPCQF